MTTETPKKKLYTVKDKDAFFIAGARVNADRTVELFPDAARYEVLAGSIEEAKPAKGAPSSASATAS